MSTHIVDSLSHQRSRVYPEFIYPELHPRKHTNDFVERKSSYISSSSLMASSSCNMAFFGRITDRIRSFVSSLLKPNQSSKRQNNGSVDLSNNIIGLLTIDFPQVSLEDDIYWDALEVPSKESTATTIKPEEVAVALPHLAIIIPEGEVSDHGFHEALDRSQTSGPSFSDLTSVRAISPLLSSGGKLPTFPFLTL